MNIHSRNEELHAPNCPTTHRQVLAGIECFGRGDLQRQIDADRHVGQRDGIIMEIGVLGVRRTGEKFTMCTMYRSFRPATGFAS